MKSFFKKLSLVLVAAMVITMLPAQSAKAATKIILGPDKATATANTAQTYELKVGESVTWSFWGVDNYNTAGKKTKVWTSSNAAVATVANGTVKAVAVGKAKITLTLTNNGIEYIGTADLTVVDKNATPVAGAPTVKQVAWNAVEITFATAEAAKAAKDGIKVTRIKTDKNGRELDLFSGASSASVKSNTEANVLVVSGLSNEVTYKLTIPGVTTPYRFTMSVGEPVAVKLTYPTVYITANDKVSQDVTGASIKYPEVTPIAEVVDANGIVCDSNATGFKFTTDKTRNVGNPNFTPVNGRIRFNKADSSCYVKCEYSYKNSEGKTVVCDYDEATVSPVPYTAPNFQGFVEKITLTDTAGKEIEYPSDYNYSASIAIGQKLNLAFYFETPNGDKYAPSLVYSTVKGSGLREDTSFKEIKADGYVYDYYVVKDDDTKNYVSVNNVTTDDSSRVEVRGFVEGTQTLCVYERATDSDGTINTTKDKLVGILNVTVEPKAEIVDIHLSENSLNGYKNTLIKNDQILSIQFKFEDQYGNNSAADVKVRDENGNLPAGVFFAKKANGTDIPTGTTNGIWRGTKTGYICVNVAKFDLSDKGKSLVVSVDDQKDPCRDTIYVTNSNIDTTKTAGYALMASNVTVKNSSIASGTNATNLALKIDVVNTKGTFRYDPWAKFYVVGDDDITKIKAGTHVEGKLLVWITREDGTVLKKDVNGREFPLASTLGNALDTKVQNFTIASGIASTVTGVGVVFATEVSANTDEVVFKDVVLSLDLIKNTGLSTSVNFVADDTFLKGRYSIYLYQGQRTGKPKFLDNIEIEVADALTKISKIDTQYELYASEEETDKGLPAVLKDNDGNKVESWDGTTALNYDFKLATQQEKLVMEIVKELYVWVDQDSNGKSVDSNGHSQGDEIGQIKDFMGDVEFYTTSNNGTGFVPYSLKYVMGAEDSHEIYITSVTLRFRINGAGTVSGIVEQTLDINHKFKY